MADKQDTAREVHPWTDFQNHEAARKQAAGRDFTPQYQKPDDNLSDGMQSRPQPTGTEPPPVEPGSTESETDTKSTEEKTIPPA